MIAPQMKYTW